MSLKIALFKIKAEKVHIWKEWCHSLQKEFNQQAIETLKEEGLESEFYTLFEIHGEFYTLAGGYQLGDGYTSDKDINRIHQEKKEECFEKKVDASILLDLHV